MRWDAIKQAWSLAKESFPGTKRLFVQMPSRFAGSGRLRVIDLDEPDKTLGEIHYRYLCRNGQNTLAMGLNHLEKTASGPTFAGEFKVATAAIQDDGKIDAEAVVLQYPNPIELGEQIAQLAAGSSDGFKGMSKIKKSALKTWIKSANFDPEMEPFVSAPLGLLGFEVENDCFNVRTAKKKDNFEYGVGDRVRVIDSFSRDYNEGGEVKDAVKREQRDYYLVLVDGSSNPAWFEAGQVQKIMAGTTWTA
jgi:hypothetical protein